MPQVEVNADERKERERERIRITEESSRQKIPELLC